MSCHISISNKTMPVYSLHRLALTYASLCIH